MIGEQRFTVVEDGAEYQLSDGTKIHFLGRDGQGVTNEEIVGVLIHRLRHQAKLAPCRESSRAITKLEEVEEVLWRRDIQKGLRAKT